MPGPGHGGPGGRSFAKPKNTKATALRVLGYLSQSKLPLVVVFLCLLLRSEEHTSELQSLLKI